MICKKCNVDKSDSEFYKYNRRGSIKPYGVCIECTKAKSKEKYNDKVEAINTLKSAIGCRKCGDKRYYVLDFHHRNPKEKDIVISDCTRKSLNALLKELKKCDVLCSNCHREWHHLYNTTNISYDTWLNENINKENKYER
jgi:hypothetical protein